MKQLASLIVLTTLGLFLFNTTSIAGDPPSYIGAKKCGMCHKTEKQGEQLKIWEGSKHSEAFKTLLSEKAVKIAKEKGVKGKASEAKECLKCHTTGAGADAKLFDKKFKIEDGVQCESCHGAGSDYKSMKVMKDRKQAVEAGLQVYEKTETLCVTCHSKESPTYKEFKFEEMWNKIKHSIPKK